MTGILEKCPKCSATEIDSGKLMSAGGVTYKSDRQWHIFVAENTVSYCCMSCGYTETFVNEKYRSKIRGMKPSDS